MTAKPERGIWLTGFLLVSLLLALVDLGFDFEVLQPAGEPSAALRFTQVADALQLCALPAIFLWSRLGVLLYLLATLAVPLLTLAQGRGTNGIGFAGALILALLIWPKWARMPWGLSLAIK